LVVNVVGVGVLIFFGVGKKVCFILFYGFATLIDANLKKNKDCWRKGANIN
jgi:hypothetical protein